MCVCARVSGVIWGCGDRGIPLRQQNITFLPIGKNYWHEPQKPEAGFELQAAVKDLFLSGVYHFQSILLDFVFIGQCDSRLVQRADLYRTTVNMCCLEVYKSLLQFISSEMNILGFAVISGFSLLENHHALKRFLLFVVRVQRVLAYRLMNESRATKINTVC